jgi:hypothetical protein
VWLEVENAYPSEAAADDWYLREYAPDGRPGLTFYWAWMEGRRGHAYGPAHPWEARFCLLVDRAPEPRTPSLPVRFWADGANWWVENRYYRLCLGRSQGGQLRGLWVAGQTQSLVEQARTYTDYGLLPDLTDSLGRKMRAVGSSERDLEPDCWLDADQQELRLHFRSYLRWGPYCQVADPRVEYETVWHLTAGPTIRVQHRARPLVAVRPQQRAFLAQTLSVPAVQRWQVAWAGRSVAGGPGQDKPGRVWQSAASPGPLQHLEITTGRGRLRLGNLQPWGEGPQNVFLLRSGEGDSYVIFLAMLDGQPVDLDARWRGYSYELTVGAP